MLIVVRTASEALLLADQKTFLYRAIGEQPFAIVLNNEIFSCYPLSASKMLRSSLFPRSNQIGLQDLLKTNPLVRFCVNLEESRQS